MGRVELYLVRHAAVDHAASDGDDPELSAIGLAQARALAERLRTLPIDSIQHSPQRRAAQTADALAALLPRCRAHQTELLRDRTPVPSPDRLDRYPPEYHAWLAETSADERDDDGKAIQAAIAQLSVPTAANEPDVRHVLVTHAFVVGEFVRHALDAPPWRWLTLVPGNASITIVRYALDAPPSLIAFNDTGHLTS